MNGQENNFLAEWNRQLDALARKDKEKQDLKRRIDLETSEEVKAQIQFNFRYDGLLLWIYSYIHSFRLFTYTYTYLLLGLGKSTC